MALLASLFAHRGRRPWPRPRPRSTTRHSPRAPRARRAGRSRRDRSRRRAPDAPGSARASEAAALSVERGRALLAAPVSDPRRATRRLTARAGTPRAGHAPGGRVASTARAAPEGRRRRWSRPGPRAPSLPASPEGRAPGARAVRLHPPRHHGPLQRRAALMYWYEDRARPTAARACATPSSSATKTAARPADRLMATWGRLTDIEYVYGVVTGADGAAVSRPSSRPGTRDRTVRAAGARATTR